MAERIKRRGAKILYIAEQTAKGTPNYPVGKHALSDIESTFEFAKKREIQDLQRRSDTYSVFDYFQCGYEASKATIKCPIKLLTYVGVEALADIHGGCLLKALYGIEALSVPNKTYTYTHRKPSTAEIYYTIATDIDDAIVWMFDCQLDTGSITTTAGASTDDVNTINCTFIGLSSAMAGLSNLRQAEIVGALTITVGNPERFTEMAQFRIAGEAGTPTHTITDVNLTTGVITFTTAIAAGGVATEAAVYGYIATSAAPAGTVIWSGRGYILEERDTLQAALIALDAHFHANHAQRFEVGQKVKFHTDATATVYTVTSVDLDATEVGISPPAVGGVNIGEEIFLLPGTLSGNIDISHPIRVEYPKQDTEWPGYLLREEKRTVKITNVRLGTDQNSELLLAQAQQKTYRIIIEQGSVSDVGKPYMVFEAPKCRVTSATYDYGNPEMQIPLEYECLATSGDDESTLTVYLL